MKRIAILLIVLCSTIFAKANFVEGQSANVIAISGLKMRTAPQFGHVIKVIPYGSQVIILNSTSEEIITDRVGWVDGKWIEISHNGDIGFIFDGFITPLSLPFEEGEIIQSDQDILFPIEVWAGNQLTSIGSSDTTTLRNGADQITHFFENGKLTKIEGGNFFKIDLQMTDIRIMDAYHLVLSMMDTKDQMEQCKINSIFIQDEGMVSEIRINLIDDITIRKIDDVISIKVSTAESGC